MCNPRNFRIKKKKSENGQIADSILKLVDPWNKESIKTHLITLCNTFELKFLVHVFNRIFKNKYKTNNLLFCGHVSSILMT